MNIAIYIGFEPKAAYAYWIQRASILRWCRNARVYPVIQQGLRMRGDYYRAPDPLASTEFTYTRFLTPHIVRRQADIHRADPGWALFMDSDMFVRGDLLSALEPYCDDNYGVLCVQHDHRPSEETKMHIDDEIKVQTTYPRKNWSSLMLFNCEHHSTQTLTPDYVNLATPADLHRFNWIEDEFIGELPVTFNWLEGWNTFEQCHDPLIVHFTRGIPGIHDGCTELPFANEYLSLANDLCECYL